MRENHAWNSVVLPLLVEDAPSLIITLDWVL